MVHTLTIVLIATLLNQICYAREIKGDARSPGDGQKLTLTVGELSYILITRRGGDVSPPKNISPCARAILTCCNEKVINPYCSEALKCGAFFLDDNPCEDKFVIDALKAAKIFYTQLNDRKT